MKSRGFLFGFGSGIIIMSAVVYFFYGKFYGRDSVRDTVVVSMTDDQVVARARELGMITYSELPARGNSTPSPVPATHEDTSVSEEISIEEIIEHARELGMVFYDEVTEDGNAESKTERTGKVTVAVPRGYTARDIALLLEWNGVVDSAENFQRFLAGKNITKQLRQGEFTFAYGSSYEEILAIIR